MLIRQVMQGVVFALAVFLWAPPSAFPQSAFVDAVQLARVALVGVVTSFSLDGVECAPNASVLETEAELVFRRSGITIANADDRRQHVFNIELSGYQEISSCVVAYNFELHRFELLIDGSLGLVESFSYGGVMTGPSYVVRDQLRSKTNEAATLLANEVLTVR